jgi:glycosyltransferase involved in cell wall biosynthesis
MITVIIATRNRASLLAKTLDAIGRQDWPGCPFEILVVDNASTDETRDVVATVHASVPIVYLREDKPGKSHALNTAVRHARGQILVLTDDDVLPSPGWLAAYVRAFGETGADYAAGRILPLWEAAQPGWLSPALYGVLAIPDGGVRRLTLSGHASDRIMPIGANMAVRRHVLERVGGWNPDLGKLHGTLRTGEDHEFALRMAAAGFAGIYEPHAVVHHRVPPDRLRIGYFQRWFYDNGTIVASLERAYPSTASYLLGVPRYLWRELGGNFMLSLYAILCCDAKRATAAQMRLAWFAGYLRGLWKYLRSTAGVGARPATIPTELR